MGRLVQPAFASYFLFMSFLFVSLSFLNIGVDENMLPEELRRGELRRRLGVCLLGAGLGWFNGQVGGRRAGLVGGGQEHPIL